MNIAFCVCTVCHFFFLLRACPLMPQKHLSLRLIVQLPLT